MDQSKSSDAVRAKVALPKRSFSLELIVGLFTMLGVACAGYLAIGLGGLQLWDTGKYQLFAEFDNVSGLKKGASVEIAGVQVGTVENLTLKDPQAIVTLQLDKGIRIKDDDIVSIRTKGIIGDRYVKISRGASDTYIKEGGTIVETESVVDIEDIIGKLVHSFTGEKSDKGDGADKGPDDKTSADKKDNNAN